MRVLFFGTAAFAVPTLRALLASPHQLVGIVTQPDRPAGRGRQLTASPIAALAREHHSPLFQPESIAAPEIHAALHALEPDACVVVAYGQFLPEPICTLAPHRAINLHPSLLPKYRGAAPIQWTLLNGDSLTGVTSLYVTKTMDAGDILLQWSVPVRPMETAAELHDRLSTLGADLIIATLDGLAGHALHPHPQDPQQVSLARKLEKTDGRIDWQQPGRAIINRIRAVQPWPGATTQWDGRPLKVFRAELPPDRSMPAGAVPGEVIDVTRSLHVATGDGRLCLTELQCEGGKRLSSAEFLRGHPIDKGTRFT